VDDDGAGDAAREAPQRDEDPNAEVDAPLHQIGSGAAPGAGDDERERGAGGCGGREAEDQAQDRYHDEAAAQADHRAEGSGHRAEQEDRRERRRGVRVAGGQEIR